jgi:osomolarity two-component system sensor histidine kinase NIK1
MQGNMWVESEMAKGSRFFFTIKSQISHSSMETTLAKMSPFSKRTILFVDTLHDMTGVVDRIQELNLIPFVVHEVDEITDKDRCPHIDTIVVDSLSVVSANMMHPQLNAHPTPIRRSAFGSLNICDIFRSSFSHHRCLA